MPGKVIVTDDTDHEAARLHREATAAKRARDWPRAIELLRQAKARAGDGYMDTRLALFLQQAGRFDEAIDEFLWLLDRAKEWSEVMFGHQPVTVRKCQLAIRQARLHDKMRLACQRAKRFDLAERHRDMRERYDAEAERLRPIADRDHRARIDENLRRTKAALADLTAKLKNK